MCRNGWGVLCVWLVSASLLTAAEPQPPSVPPQFAVVIKLDAEAGEVELRQTVMKPVNETVEQAITNPATGKVEIATFLRTIYVSEVRARRLKLADARVITATQDAVEPDDVAGLTDRMARLIADPARRAALAAAGFERLHRHFDFETWIDALADRFGLTPSTASASVRTCA